MVQISEKEFKRIQRNPDVEAQNSTDNTLPGRGGALISFEGKIDEVAGNRKFKNRKCVIDGYEFDSLAERSRYLELKVLERAGKIQNLRLQPRYRLQDAFTDCSGRRHRAIDYVGDFEYVEDGRVTCEDVKGGRGTATATYRVKIKLAIRKYPHIHFLEVYR